MVELCCMHMFIHNYTFTGVMKVSYVKDFHLLKLKFDFFRILSNDRQLIHMVAKSCLENPVNPNALKLVSTELIYSKIMDYYEAEAFRNYLYFVNFRDLAVDQKQNQMWQIEFGLHSKNDANRLQIILATIEVLRLYNYVNSFYSNYLTNDLAAKLIYNNNNNNNKETKKITELIPEQQVLSSQEGQQDKKETDDLINDNNNNKNDFDEIFNLCLTQPIKSSLIHYTLSYYKPLITTNNNICKLQTSSKGQVKVTYPLLVPGNFSIDETYFKSLILTANLHVNNVVFIIRKLMSMLLTRHNEYKDKPIHLLMIGYLLFIYLMKYFYEVNRASFRDSFSKVICNPNVQKLLFMNLIKNTFTEFHNKLFFEFTFPGAFTSDNINENSISIAQDELEKLSKEYRHLIPVSQEEFINRIFDKISNDHSKKSLPLDFKINNKKIIDISNYIINDNNNNQQKRLTHFFDPDNSLSPVESEILNEYKYLNYKLISSNGSKIISESYGHLLNYIKDPSSILLIKDDKIPKNVLNLFDTLSKYVLTKDKIKKDDISTLYYYNLLVDSLADPAAFKHYFYLYIIFQIIIPYHYDIYNNTQFIDVFL